MSSSFITDNDIHRTHILLDLIEQGQCDCLLGVILSWIRFVSSVTVMIALGPMQEFGSKEHHHTTALPIFDMKYTHLLSLRSHFLGLKQLSTNFEGPFV